MRLRPIEPDDYTFLYRTAHEATVGYRWRHRGATISPGDFEASLWDEVLVHFLVEKKKTTEPVGSVFCYRPDLQNGHAYLALVIAPRFHHVAWPFEAIGLLVDYLFESFSFRKLYVESTEYNFAAFGEIARSFLVEEGILRSHQYYGGQYWDVRIAAIYRDRWAVASTRLRRNRNPRNTLTNVKG